jgi:hypothetical protein
VDQVRGRIGPTCAACGGSLSAVSSRIGVCRACLMEDFEAYRDRIQEAHASGRVPYGLPAEVPFGGPKTCRVCGNLHLLRG